MLTAIKAEFKKFLTVRSTYLVTGFLLVLVTFLSVYVMGYHQAAAKAASEIYLADTIYTMVGTAMTFIAVLAMLLVAHEYRYNTILYSLTLARQRLNMLLGKLVVMWSYAILVTLVVIAIAVYGSQLGLRIKGVELAPQQFALLESLWQSIAYAMGYALVGLILATLIRGLVGTIVTFFVLSSVEGLLMPLLKENSKYLPFRSLDSIPVVTSPNSISAGFPTLDNLQALGLFTVYAVIFGTIAVIGFVRRDAN